MNLGITLSPLALTSTKIWARHVSRSEDRASESGVSSKVMGWRFGTTSEPDLAQKGEFSTPPSECFFSLLLTFPPIQTLSEDCFHIILCLSSDFQELWNFLKCQWKGMCWLQSNGLEEGSTPFLKMARFQNVRSQRWTAGFRSFLDRVYYMCSYWYLLSTGLWISLVDELWVHQVGVFWAPG